MPQGEAQGFFNRWSVSWYRKMVRLEKKEKDRRYWIDFGGIYKNSTIWCNGHLVGGRKYSYSSFRLELTQWLVLGENEILIKVDNTQQPADRWYSGGGIYRTVSWIETGKDILDENNIVVTSAIDFEENQARVEVGLGTEQLVSRVLTQGDNSYESVSRKGTLLFNITEPALWSAENPTLYTLGRHFGTQWKNDIECMVRRDRNRPSIIVWGVGNEVENQGQDSMIVILEMLANQVRSLDPTRPVTYAMNPILSMKQILMFGK